jgi:outer membrane receptor protein involved in Fe transport
MRGGGVVGLGLWVVAGTLPALADPVPAPTPTYTVDVRERRPVSAASSFVRDARSFDLRRLESPGDILEVAPGVKTSQHAGGGKANQILVRGFDADHGTDLGVFVDRVPVNMRSHAHGQGYTDLHFVIPETVERIEITKGTYDAEVGDFSTAGSVNLVTRESVPESFVRVEGGEFHTQRYLAVLSPRTGAFGGSEPRASALVALEAFGSDGPFSNGEDYWRYAAFGRLGYDLTESTRLEASTHLHFADWDASGQIPQRAVDGPGFGRWDAVDPSDGGESNTWRSLLRVVHDVSPRERLEGAAWLIHYDLDLYSNFTFFLNDPVLGDQIVQRDDRIAYGGWLGWRRAFEGTPVPVSVSVGLDTRSDDAHVRLGNSRDRDEFETVDDDDVLERSFAAFSEVEVLPLPWVRTVLGVRAEQFRFDVSDHTGTAAAAEGHVSEGVLLPKANLILSPFAEDGLVASPWQPLRDLELFLNYGKGYHSNDARDVVDNPREPTLPGAQGAELGARTRLFGRLDLAVAYWWLNLQREFVFVGDEGTTELRPRSRRRGIEVSAEADLLDWLLWFGDLGYSSAEFSNGDTVPQAVRFTATTGLVARHSSGVSAELLYETLGSRYGVEDRSERLRGWGVVDFTLRYRRGPAEVFLGVENVFDTEWESAEYFFASRLPGEPVDGALDLHFVPGNPRNVQLGLSFYF